MNALALLEASRTLSSLVESPVLRELDSASEGVIVVDHHARVRWLGQRYRTCMGLPQGDYFNGRPVEEILPDCILRQVTRDARPVRLDLCCQNGSWLVESRLPLRDRNGKLIGALAMVHSRHADLIGHFAAKCLSLFARSEPVQPVSPALHATGQFRDFVGSSDPMLEMLDQGRQAARLDASVLLLGETGVGKDMLAHAIHNASVRRHLPFVALNLRAMPDELLERELAGRLSEETGDQGLGAIRSAGGGTLYIDDVGDLSMTLQLKLLRLIQMHDYGATDKGNFQIVASSRACLIDRMNSGNFRPELYYRLCVLSIDLPPLRRHLCDLPELCDTFLGEISRGAGLRRKSISSEALTYLASHAWPGNLRELRNALEQAAIFSKADRLEPEHFVLDRESSPSPCLSFDGDAVKTLSETLSDAEQRAIDHALRVSDNNRSQAARLLGISRASLYGKMRRLGVAARASC